MGCIPFSPLAQGLLTNKYLKGIPADSRAAKPHGFLQEAAITEGVVSQLQKLNGIAEKRNQSLAQISNHFEPVGANGVGIIAEIRHAFV